jgi:serine/threonine protein kinase
VNLERLPNSSLIATKYSLNGGTLKESIAEVATFKYLEGLPHVAQFLGTANANAGGAVCPAFPCILMESARSNLENTSLYTDWETTLKAVIGVLKGYNVLHGSHIVHRDTKPANMLMSTTGEVYITDFGASRFMNPYEIPSQDGYTGTVWWSSPEVLMKKLLAVEGEPYSYEGWFANDAWAVGMSIYYIITGQNLAPERNKLEVLKKIFFVKGRPIAKDGEVFDLTARLSAAATSIMTQTAQRFRNRGERWEDAYTRLAPQPPNAIKDTMIHYARYPTNIPQLEVIGTIVEGLSDYNPLTRMTIRGALRHLMKHKLMPPQDINFSSGKTLFQYYKITPDPATVNNSLNVPWTAVGNDEQALLTTRKGQPKKLNFNRVAAKQRHEATAAAAAAAAAATAVPGSQITQRGISATLEWLATIVLTKLGEDNLAHIFDRSCVIFYGLVKYHKEQLSFQTIRAWALACMLIAYNLFTQTNETLTISHIHSWLPAAMSVSTAELNRMVRFLILSDIEFLGVTFYDELRLAMGGKYETRCDVINNDCLVLGLYDQYLQNSSVPAIINYLTKYVRSGKPITSETLAKGIW